MPSSTEPVPVRTYEVVHDDGGAVRIDIPETWKVTYGPIVGVGKAMGSGMAFRAWESETKQRLLITGVSSFRDISIPVQVAAIRPFGWQTWHRESEAWFRPEDMELVERAWKPIDEVNDREIRPADLLKKANDPGEDEDPEETVALYKPTSWRDPVSAPVTRRRRV